MRHRPQDAAAMSPGPEAVHMERNSGSSAGAPHRGRELHRLAVAMLAGLLAISVLIGFLMVPRDDAVGSPDAIVVLGGAGSERAELGIHLHETYGVPLVLSSSAQDFAEDRGYGCPPAICILTDPETTLGEAREISELANERGWNRITVVTTRFHTTRARLLFRQCLGDRVSVVGARAGSGPGLPRWVNEVGGVVIGSTFDRAC
jgi:uncharacterized SAM-binding protein YcdF (DUF218 family)